MLHLIEKAENNHDLTREELILLLEDTGCSEELFAAADRVRKQYVGDEIHLRGLIEFSNICRNNCCYCGLRRDNTNLKRYRIDEDTIVKMAEHARNMGLKTVVLQSGEDLYFTTERLTRIISRIHSLGLALTLSIGEKVDYRAYREAGANRFLLRIETTDKELYHRFDPGMSWEARAQCLQNLRRAGLEVGSGCLVGLPGQTTSSYADDILFFKKIDADMIGIGPFIPHKDTPFAKFPAGTVEQTCFLLSLIRLIKPNILLPSTTALGTIDPNGREKGILAGANVVMPNLSPIAVRKKYSLYDNKICTGDESAQCLKCLNGRLNAIGFQTVTSRGDIKR